GRRRQTAPLRDPVAKRAICRVVRLKPSPALVWRAQQGFLKHKAFGRSEDVGSSPERLASEAQGIKLRGEPAETQTTSPLPLWRPVACPLVAPPAPERGHHLRTKINRRLLTETNNPNPNAPRMLAIPNPQHGLPRPARRHEPTLAHRRHQRVIDFEPRQGRQVRLNRRAMLSRDEHSLSGPVAIQNDLGRLHRDSSHPLLLGAGARMCERTDRGTDHQNTGRSGDSRCRFHAPPPFAAATTTSIGLPETGSSNLETR